MNLCIGAKHYTFKFVSGHTQYKFNAFTMYFDSTKYKELHGIYTHARTRAHTYICLDLYECTLL